ncbi:hypothetical protein ACVWWG_001965 [Bradyrhizobium sp. LB7.2]
MATSPCRSCQPRPVEGDVGDRELPHGSRRRPCCGLRGLRLYHDGLQLLPQPALPEVPGRRCKGLACRPRGRAVAGAVLSRGVHAACSHRRHRLPEQDRDLQPLVQSLGRPHRHHLRAAHLGFGAHPSPARAHDLPGGGISPDGTRWVSCRPGFFLPVRVLWRLYRRLLLEKLIGTRLYFFGNQTPLADAQAFAAHLAPLRNAEWVVYAKRPFGGPPRPCWPICRAIHTASPSPTAA